jgi:predicted acetyltransferase
MTTIKLVKPSLVELPSYKAALEAGWSPDNVRTTVAANEQLDRIAADAAAFVAGLDDPAAVGGPIPLPDGSVIARLPSIVRWMWDGDFCGSIGFRWQSETPALPPHVLGHIGFSVVPWKRGRGYARQALLQILVDARQRGLPYVDLTTDPHNIASQRAIAACRGEMIERFQKVAAYGNAEALRFRIQLADSDTDTRE